MHSPPLHRPPVEGEADGHPLWPPRPVLHWATPSPEDQSKSAATEGTLVEFLPLTAHPQHFVMVPGRGSSDPDSAHILWFGGGGGSPGLRQCQSRAEGLKDSFDSLHFHLWLTSSNALSPPRWRRPWEESTFFLFKENRASTHLGL